jgi:hypothetical protein
MDTYLAFLPLSRKPSLRRSAPAAYAHASGAKKGNLCCSPEAQPCGQPRAFSNSKGLSVAVAVLILDF